MHKLNVSIHAPARGATLHCPMVSASISSFNSRSREGSDPILLESWTGVKHVSIHAPARGATRKYYRRFLHHLFQFTLPRGERLLIYSSPLCWHVSIHAPARGATADKRCRVELTEFQFTLPRGERPTVALQLVVERDVSIHAPARGATIALPSEQP